MHETLLSIKKAVKFMSHAQPINVHMERLSKSVKKSVITIPFH